MTDPRVPDGAGAMTPAAEHAGPVAANVAPRSGIGRWFVRLYAALHGLAERGWAATAIGTWSFLQSALVPGPVDALLVPLGIADPPKAYRFAWAAVFGAVLGTLVGYTAGALAYDTVGIWVLNLFGVEGEGIDVWRGRFQRQGWWVVFLSTMTPVSAKLVSVAAGAFGMPLWQFLGAMFIGRTIRFLTVAFVVRRFGRSMDGWVQRRYGVSLNELARGERRSR
ncbi:MAG: DedA family protein [Gemmatimonadaceae bacterium]|nr:DedA family protein [Gemmatimonadaceae bacterium]